MSKDTYYKQVRKTDAQMVWVNIYRTIDNERVGYKHFDLPFLKSVFGHNGKDIAKMLDKAHKWADEYILAIDGKECL